MLESFLWVLLSSLSEAFRVNDVSDNLTSYSIAVTFSIAMVALITIVMLFYRLNKEASKSPYLGEFYSGMKPNPMAQMYYFVFMTRRLLIILAILSMRSVLPVLKLSVYTLVQLLVLAYIAVYKPYEKTYENLVELVNDTVYTLI